MIKIENVSKEYVQKGKRLKILEDISYNVPNGKVVALLGANGSGKSTLIKCICGVIKPTSGKVVIDDKDTFIQRKKVIGNMGVVFNQKPSFIVDLSVNDNLEYFKAIYNISKDKYQQNLEYLDGYLKFYSLLDKPYRKLSFGERVKCEIISVLLHDPSYIILDEPTIGLDYLAKRGLYDLLNDLKRRGSTIIITTHEIDYIEDICDEAIILSNGKLVYQGNPKKILSQCGRVNKISIEYVRVLDADLSKCIMEEYSCEGGENSLEISFPDIEQKKEITDKLMTAYDITKFNVNVATIREALENVLKKME